VETRAVDTVLQPRKTLTAAANWPNAIRDGLIQRRFRHGASVESSDFWSSRRSASTKGRLFGDDLGGGLTLKHISLRETK
jgi:hypothetical protein